MHATCFPATDPEFLRTLESWLKRRSELLVLIRYSQATGAQGFEMFSSFADLKARILELPPLTNLIAFKYLQLKLRGVVDDAFIAECLKQIPGDSEYLVVETVRRVCGKNSWFHDYAGVSHEELRDDLEESRGVPVAVGLYPTWSEDSEEVICAVVPDEHGMIRVEFMGAPHGDPHQAA